MTYEQELDILRREYDEISERIMQRHKQAQTNHIINTALYRKDTPNNTTNLDRKGRSLRLARLTHNRKGIEQ